MQVFVNQLMQLEKTLWFFMSVNIRLNVFQILTHVPTQLRQNPGEPWKTMQFLYSTERFMKGELDYVMCIDVIIMSFVWIYNRFQVQILLTMLLHLGTCSPSPDQPCHKKNRCGL